MRIDLTKILDNPGESLGFECDLEPEDLQFEQIKSYKQKPHANGVIRNTAGVIELTGELEAPMVCICDRCTAEYDLDKKVRLEATLSEDESDLEDPEIFPIEENGVDVDDIVRTLFVLSLEPKFLCSEDCKGLCPSCGKNLNEGPCGCKEETDPRWAVLEQLLDDKD